MRPMVPLLVFGIGTLIAGGLLGQQSGSGLPSAPATKQSLIKQSHGVRVQLLGVRYLAEKKSLLVRVVYEAQDYKRFRFGDPVIVFDGQQKNAERSIADAGYWQESVKRNQRRGTWVVTGIGAMPKRVDVEIPFIRFEEDKPQVLWDAVRVDGNNKSLGTSTSEYYDIKMRQIQFHPKGATVKNLAGSASTEAIRSRRVTSRTKSRTCLRPA